ncbi:Uncharacterised protein [Bordetella pertussis]|nr:Uncharacterised protein [Bordetella pertussis]
MVRASRMPSSRPLMTAPTTLPRSCGSARVAANGTRTCATTDSRPVTAVPSMSQPMPGEKADSSRPTADRAVISAIRVRRS